MIFRPKRFQPQLLEFEQENPQVRKLMPSRHYEDDLYIVPKVFSGKELQKHLFPKKQETKDGLTPQPCSLDVLIEELTDKEGQPLPFPAKVPPGGEFIGLSHLTYRNFEEKTVLCVETRSGYARRGLACLGFGFFKEPFVCFGANLDFLFRNCLESPIYIPGPFSPVQVSEAKYVADLSGTSPPLRLIKNSEEVSKENEILIDNFSAYVVHLDEELVYFKKSKKPVNLLDQGAFEKLAVGDDIYNIEKARPGFCLTKTEEYIQTNGCPAYIFPFHYLDVTGRTFYLGNLSSLSEMFHEIFSDREFLPVTANAGLINPGNTGKIICENITQGRDLKKYFKAHEPFALVIPIPFYDGKLDNDSYQSGHRHQEKIVF